MSLVIVHNGKAVEIPIAIEVQGGAAIAEYLEAHAPASPAKPKEKP